MLRQNLIEATKNRIEELQNTIEQFLQHKNAMNQHIDSLKKEINYIETNWDEHEQHKTNLRADNAVYNYFCGSLSNKREISILEMDIGSLENRLKLNSQNINAMNDEIGILGGICQGKFLEAHYQSLEQTKDYSFHFKSGNYWAKDEKSKFFATYQKELKQLIEQPKLSNFSGTLYPILKTEPLYPDLDPARLYPDLRDKKGFWLRR